jgi:hypothetical protein
LTETSKILEIIFQFIHPCSQENDFHQSSVFNLTVYGLFFGVAEAAEKYIVFGADLLSLASSCVGFSQRRDGDLLCCALL